MIWSRKGKQSMWDFQKTNPHNCDQSEMKGGGGGGGSGDDSDSDMI